jgi:hypothetical protein
MPVFKIPYQENYAPTKNEGGYEGLGGVRKKT